jgi:hypothetical protein
MKSITVNILITVMSLAAISSLPFRSWGQADDAGKALQAIRSLAAKYQQAQYLSFDIVYRYAAENKPGVYLDSLRGQYKLHGNRYWSILDNRESIYDTRLLLMRFEEDSIIYLAKPGTGAKQAGAGNVGLAMLDTVLFNTKDAQYAWAETNTEQLVTVSFIGPVACRRMTWHIDRATGLLTKMVSLVRSEQLYDPSVRSQITEAATSYVIVETLYSNYRQGAFTDKVFDLGKYIKKEGQDYVTVAPYERYKVFIGTPGL